MNNSYFVYCYDCQLSIATSEKGLQGKIKLYGDYYPCKCGNKIKLRLTKSDWRKFKLKKVKERMR